MSGAGSELLVVMYHLVHGPGTPHIEGLPGPDRAGFAAQLRALQAAWPTIAYGELVEALAGERALPPRCSLVTFDDGTIDHYLNAFPVLRELGLSAVFFAITGSVEERLLTPVHARHLMSTRVAGPEFQARFLAALERREPGGARTSVDPAVARKAYRWDDEATACFKYLVNFELPEAIRNAVLRELFEEVVGDWDAMGDRHYLSWAQLREMQQGGMTIGGHSHRHEALGMMEEADMRDDVARCRRLLDAHLAPGPLPFSYPYGKPQHYSPAVVEAVRQAGFLDAFVNVQGVNRLPVAGAARYELRRIDPKDLPEHLGAGS